MLLSLIISVPIYENPNSTSANRNDNEAASVVAYLWKGSYTNKQKVGYNGAEEDMTDRDRFVLGSMQSTASDDAKLIAEINAKIEGNVKFGTAKRLNLPTRITILLQRN